MEAQGRAVNGGGGSSCQAAAGCPGRQGRQSCCVIVTGKTTGAPWQVNRRAPCGTENVARA